MTYEKEHSYLSRLAEKANDKLRRGVLFGAIGLASYTGLEAILELVYPPVKSAQAQEQKEKTLLEKIKEYTAAIKDYEAKKDTANIDAQKELLNLEILKEPRSLDEYVRALSLANKYLSSATIAVAAENIKPLLLIDSKNKKQTMEMVYSIIRLRATDPGLSAQTKFSILLEKWAYSDLLIQSGVEKYRGDRSSAKTELNNLYASMGPEERKNAKAIADAYGLGHIVQEPAVQQPKPAPAPEAKPEQKQKPEVKPEPKPEPKPEVKPAPKPEVKPEPKKPETPPTPKPQPAAQPKPEPKKEPQSTSLFAAQPPLTPQSTLPQPDQKQTEPGRDGPSYIELGTSINSNKSTQGNRHHASLITPALEIRGIYDFMQWRNIQDEMTTRATTAGAAEIKPLVITKIADILGAEIPKELVNFLTIGVAGESQTTTRRNFEQQVDEDPDFKITTDTATRNILLDNSILANAAVRLVFLEFCAAGSARSQRLTTAVDTAVYIINKTDPAGNHSMSSRTELENIINEQRFQGEIKYVFETMLGGKTPFAGRIGMLADHTQTREELAGGTEHNTRSTLFGLTAQGNIADTLLFNAIAAEELYNGPGERNDGWQDTLAFLSVFLRGEGKTVRDIHAKPVYSAKVVAMMNGWMRGENWGAGAGFVAGTGAVNAEYWNSMLADFGRAKLGLDRTLGQTLSGMEIERYMRIMPLALEKGFSVFAFGGINSGRNEDNNKVMGAWGYAGLKAGSFDITGTYEDDHIARRIGGRVGADFKTVRISLGFISENNKNQDDSSQTGVAEIIIPLE